jgi:hypothetical protein
VPGGYEGTWKQRANTRSADEATSRALKALEVAQATGARTGPSDPLSPH